MLELICCLLLDIFYSVGDAKWLLVSTEELYGMSLNSSGRGRSSRHHQRSRLPPVLSSAVMPAVTQCEVAFPGNRILSPSPTDEVRLHTDHLVDVHQTDTNEVVDHQPSNENFLSLDDHISGNTSNQLASNVPDADTSVAAASDCVRSLSMTHAEFSNDSEVVENTGDIKSAVSRGIYMENVNADVVPLEPVKAEKLATFGEFVIVLTCIINLLFYYNNNYIDNIILIYWSPKHKTLQLLTVT